VEREEMKKILALVIAVALMLSLAPVTAMAFDDGGMVLIWSTPARLWTDPGSGGQVLITVHKYEGVELPDGTFIPHDMTWVYEVENLNYDPEPGVTNGFSGFQILFPGPVAELYNQQSPTIGGPWKQNSFSGQFPPWGVEWDADLPGTGIMPGQTGVFSFCTFERVNVFYPESGSGSGPAGWAHTWGLSLPEPIIDLDGSATPGVGSTQEVAILDTIRGWPTGAYVEGIDWFDNDGDCTWTFGVDDLHVEGSAHPTALRDGWHDNNASYIDPMVLDQGTPLADGAQVDVDLETGTTFTGCSGPDPLMKFYDTNGNGFWDDGEDIVYDTNNDNVFGMVANTQTYTHHGPIAVPGRPWNMLDVVSSEPGIISKKVKYIDMGPDADDIINVGEYVYFMEVIQVHNPSVSKTFTDVMVTDRFGAEIALDFSWTHANIGTYSYYTKGKSEKVFLEWDIGTLGPGDTANLVLWAYTDLNPAGHQEYTEPGIYEFNSGAVVKFRVNGKQNSFETGSVMVSVSP
jgi:hypothetical protein